MTRAMQDCADTKRQTEGVRPVGMAVIFVGVGQRLKLSLLLLR